MELIKKTVQRIMTTGVTACTGTTGNCYVLIPDLTVNYYFKIGLTAETEDIGFFDAYVQEVTPEPPEPPVPVETYRYTDSDSPFTDSDGAYFVWQIIV